ncbi:hypothetical protein M9458_018335, partial [Cirrhinus mrigala]
QGPMPGEWMLHPEVVKQIWEVFGPAQVDLFALRENAQFHPAPLGLDAMVQTSPGRGQSLVGSPVLAGLSMALGPDFSPRRLSIGDSVRRDLLLQAGGTPQPVVLQAFCPLPFREPDQQKHNCMCQFV